MKFDLRFPLGILFAIYGVILAGYGLLSDKAIYQKSLGMNVNLYWGLVLLVFGLWMLIMAWRGAKSRPSDKSPE